MTPGVSGGADGDSFAPRAHNPMPAEVDKDRNVSAAGSLCDALPAQTAAVGSRAGDDTRKSYTVAAVRGAAGR